MRTELLPSWRGLLTREAVEGFLATAVDVDPTDRVACFDNDRPSARWSTNPCSN